jgi:hypothetical protein
MTNIQANYTDLKISEVSLDKLAAGCLYQKFEHKIRCDFLRNIVLF